MAMNSGGASDGTSQDTYWNLMQPRTSGTPVTQVGQGNLSSAPLVGRPLAVHPIGQTGLNHVVYPDGTSGIHDDSGARVPPHVVAAVLQGPGVAQTVASHRRRLGHGIPMPNAVPLPSLPRPSGVAPFPPTRVHAIPGQPPAKVPPGGVAPMDPLNGHYSLRGINGPPQRPRRK